MLSKISTQLFQSTLKGVCGFASRKPLFKATTNPEDDWIKVVHLDDAADHLPAHKLK